VLKASPLADSRAAGAAQKLAPERSMASVLAANSAISDESERGKREGRTSLSVGVACAGTRRCAGLPRFADANLHQLTQA
jgi:hypothetical protein